MGICESIEDRKARNISYEIEKEIRINKLQKPIKLLLLGPSESGKSTVVRQIRILHQGGFSEEEINERRFIVYSNTDIFVRSMYEIIVAMENKGLISPSNSILQESVQKIIYHVESGLEFSPIPEKVSIAIHQLWNEKFIRDAYEQYATTCHVNNNAKFFFENIERISAQDYRPTNQDILMTRMPTIGIVKIPFKIRNLNFCIIDVGGQRTQRRKWIHFFDDTDLIIFIAAINEYDQKLREDNKMNRLLESLALFDNISNCVFLMRASIVLFLNKKDLFREKIDKIPMNNLFSSYQDGGDYKKAIAFIRKEFHCCSVM